MAENLFNREHKATSEAYRTGYDRIDWCRVTQRKGLVTQREEAVYQTSDSEDDGYAD